MNIGVYIIKHITSGKVYVGSSKNILARWNVHKKQLNKGIHGNKKLQNSWNKYGECDFAFEIKEICTNSELVLREQFWITSHDAANNGFNILPYARSTKGLYGKDHPASKPYTLRSPAGELVNFTGVAAFGRAHNLDKRYIFRILNGEKLTYKGWANPVMRESRLTKQFSLISPTGNFVTVRNLKRFSRENNLSYQCMAKVVTNKNKQHKGWKVYGKH